MMMDAAAPPTWGNETTNPSFCASNPGAVLTPAPLTMTNLEDRNQQRNKGSGLSQTNQNSPNHAVSSASSSSSSNSLSSSSNSLSNTDSSSDPNDNDNAQDNEMLSSDNSMNGEYLDIDGMINDLGFFPSDGFIASQFSANATSSSLASIQEDEGANPVPLSPEAAAAADQLLDSLASTEMLSLPPHPSQHSFPQAGTARQIQRRSVSIGSNQAPKTASTFAKTQVAAGGPATTAAATAALVPLFPIYYQPAQAQAAPVQAQAVQQVSPTLSSTSNSNFQFNSMLEHQQATIQRNQQIIDGQNYKLSSMSTATVVVPRTVSTTSVRDNRKKQPQPSQQHPVQQLLPHLQPLRQKPRVLTTNSTVPPVSGTSSTIVKRGRKPKGTTKTAPKKKKPKANTKKKSTSTTTSTTDPAATTSSGSTSGNGNNKNAYMKWKCTAEGATKLKELDSVVNTTTEKLRGGRYPQPIRTYALYKQQQRQQQLQQQQQLASRPLAASTFPPRPYAAHGGNITPLVASSASAALTAAALDGSGGCFAIDEEGKQIITPELLEVRRERNRKHAKKSRLRKKDLTSQLEQSLDELRDENTKLRECIEKHFAAKQRKQEPPPLASVNYSDPTAVAPEAIPSSTTEAGTAAIETVAVATPPLTVDELLEQRRVRSHDHFIHCIMKTTKGTTKKRKREATTTGDGTVPTAGATGPSSPASASSPTSLLSMFLPSSKPRTSSGKGVILNDKTIKILKALSKNVIKNRSTITSSLSSVKAPPVAPVSVVSSSSASSSSPLIQYLNKNSQGHKQREVLPQQASITTMRMPMPLVPLSSIL